MEIKADTVELQCQILKRVETWELCRISLLRKGKICTGYLLRSRNIQYSIQSLVDQKENMGVIKTSSVPILDAFGMDVIGITLFVKLFFADVAPGACCCLKNA